MKGALAKAIALEDYPLTVIKFCIQVVQDDGSMLSTAINACMIAAVDAGLSLRYMALSVTIAFRQLSADAEDSEAEPVLMLDPAFDEELPESCSSICMVRVLSGVFSSALRSAVVPASLPRSFCSTSSCAHPNPACF